MSYSKSKAQQSFVQSGRGIKAALIPTREYSFLEESSSEENSFSASNFLKNIPSSEEKKKPTKTFKHSQSPLSKHKSEYFRPKTSHGLVGEDGIRYKGSSALSRFAALEKRIKSRQIETTLKASSSFSDLDASSESEAQASKKERVEHPEHRLKRNDIHSSFTNEDEKKNPRKINDEDKNISKKKSVSFANHLVQSEPSASDVSLDNFMPYHPSDDDISLNDMFSTPKLQNVMSLDDLISASDTTAEKEDYGVGILQLHSVDELLSTAEDEQLSFQEKSHSSSSTDSNSNLFNLHSLEELEQAPALSPIQQKNDHENFPGNIFQRDKTRSPEVFKGTGTDKVADKPMTSGSNDYSSDFHSDSEDTLKDTDSIMEDLSEKSMKTESSVKTATVSLQSNSTVAESIEKGTSYSESFESVSSSCATIPSTVQKKSVAHLEASVQTDPVRVLGANGVTDFARSDKTFFSPSPIISNEALVVLTSYSPGVLALHEMLKQQLVLTKNFIERSERLRKTAAESLVADYQYASLQEAKELIDLRRQRLSLPAKYSEMKSKIRS
ncbi:uncharacterized protein LOC143459514 isoform X3 [Clavelina lepadiformis]|uniref:uncharacterized protein LOC143459514 isoform X3 n=1 Tax=Clavelina lepadiformis TaxID=159417 RepID=UPI0040432842